MKKFMLEIELGNDAMNSYCDVAAVRISNDTLLIVGQRQALLDANGNVVGEWCIVRETYG